MKRLLLAVLLLLVPAAAQGQALPFIKSQWFTNAGVPAALYKLCTYAAGTTTPLSTYATAADALAGTNAIAPPRTLDSAGRLDVFLSTSAYKIILYAPGTGNTCNGSSVGTALWTEDNIRDTRSDQTVNDLTASSITADDIAVTNLDADFTVSGTVTDSALTNGRVVLAGMSGLLGDDADLTFSGDTLTAVKILTNEIGSSSGEMPIKTYMSGNITLEPATAATAAVTTNARFQTALGTTIVSGDCTSGDCTFPGDGNFFVVSGTTTVDGWATAGWQAGSRVLLTTTGSITFSDSGTVAAGFAAMKLEGGMDVSMTADDLIELVYTGTTWDQVAPVLVK